jgi:hypothetical protein
MESLFDTATAAQWLTAHGVRRSPLTLRKLRCLGGGPSYRLLNGKPYYTEDELVAWVEERLSAPQNSSSEPEPVRDRGGSNLQAVRPQKAPRPPPHRAHFELAARLTEPDQAV